MEKEIVEIVHPCTVEPQMGRCTWGWCEKYKGYLCSICGKEVIKIEEVK